MKLIELSPEWLTPDVFIFRNPTGGEDWLSCKRVPMSTRGQIELFAAVKKGQSFVPTKAEFAWQFNGQDFATLTVMPSIDCSSSGNWHGFIRNGDIITV